MSGRTREGDTMTIKLKCYFFVCRTLPRISFALCTDHYAEEPRSLWEHVGNVHSIPSRQGLSSLRVSVLNDFYAAQSGI